MTKTLSAAPLYAVLFCTFVAFHSVCSADNYDVFLLAGQSNMDGRGLVSELPEEHKRPVDNAIIFYRNSVQSSEGWQTLVPGFSVPPKYKGGFPSPTFGPEIGFARSMLQGKPERRLALIKGSKGGTSLRTDWKPGAKGDKDSQGPRYRDFIETIRMATKQLRDRGDQFTIRGFLWHQGESDKKSSTDTYRRRLKEFIVHIREDVGVPDLPVVVGEVYDNGQRDSVRAAIQAVAAESSTVGLVSSEGTTTSDPGTHFDTKSQLLLGTRYANAMRELPAAKRQKVSASFGQRKIERPNVLLITVDDLNDWVGCLGGNPDAQNPNLDQLAGQSVLFSNAHCQVALCNASRDIMTGMYASTTGMPWEESTCSLLIVRAPNFAGNGSVCQRTVGLIDIYSTLAELCGLQPPGQLQGLSLRPLLENPKRSWGRPALTSTKAGNHTVRSDRWRYIRYVDGSEELYDHDSDPNEWHNIAGKASMSAIKKQHAEWIDRLTANERLD